MYCIVLTESIMEEDTSHRSALDRIIALKNTNSFLQWKYQWKTEMYAVENMKLN